MYNNIIKPYKFKNMIFIFKFNDAFCKIDLNRLNLQIYIYK